MSSTSSSEETNGKDEKNAASQATAEEDAKARKIMADKRMTGADYRCDYCRDELVDQIRIKCADCKDFDLCVVCFALGVCVEPHESDHRYRVIEPVRASIFDNDWSGDEEVLLLEGIALYGLGNWGDICDHVGTKSRYRCETHYNKCYLKSETQPFPKSLLKKEEVRNKEEKGENLEGLLEEINSFEKPHYPSLDISPPPVKTPKSRSEIHPSLLSANVTWFSPCRGDFEVEHDNDAEKLLADMQFSDSDTKQEKELKLNVIKIYNKKLAERKRRKEFVIERGLNSILGKNKRKLNPDEKAICQSLKPLARFHSGEAHEKLLKGLYNELRLRKRIEELQRYRLNGLKTFSEIASFEKQKIVKLQPSKPPVKRCKRTHSGEDLEGVDPKDDGTSSLSEEEKRLCGALELKPFEFLKIKEAIERETFIKGMIGQKDNNVLISIKIHRTPKQINFFICKNGGKKEEVLETVTVKTER